MTVYLELVLLVAFTVSVTGFLITGAVRLALKVAMPATRTGGRQARPGPWTSPSGESSGRTARKHQACATGLDDLTQSQADDGSSAERRKWET